MAYLRAYRGDSRARLAQGLVLVATLAITALLVLSCASELPYEVKAPKRNSVPREIARLGGEFMSSQGERVNLAALSDRAVILIFGQDTCSVCAHEADELRKTLTVPGQPPSRVQVITLLVGAIVDDAVDWKAEHDIPWLVGTDRESTIFSRYCEERTVPCNVVFVPEQGVVYRHTGLSRRAELESWSGRWD